MDEGLSQEEVEQRLEEYGENVLDEQEAVSPWELLWQNLNNIIVYLLLTAAVISVVMGDWVEAIAILLAVLISVLTGFFVELSAQQSVNALQDMVETKVNVLRNGDSQEIQSTEVVPEDILLLEDGDAIPADGRLLEANNFAVIEASLTGESEAIDKDPDAEFSEEVPMGDQTNMVFSGTAATRGSAKVLVTATGMDTEVGDISGMIDEEDETDETPLDKEINQLARALIIVAIVAAALVLVIGLFTGQPFAEMLHTAVILAVAAIPEALPAVKTITLANGMNQMSDYEALVKPLDKVETLGSTSVNATDKTGTLTENQMMVERIVLANGEVYDVSGRGYEPEGDVHQDEEAIAFSSEQALETDDLDEAELLCIISFFPDVSPVMHSSSKKTICIRLKATRQMVP